MGNDFNTLEILDGTTIPTGGQKEVGESSGGIGCIPIT